MGKSILNVVNIYFVIPYFFGEQLLYFASKGYNVHIVCSPSPELREYAQSHHFVYKEIDIFRKISILQDFSAIVSIIDYIRKQKIEVISGHTPKGAWLAMLAGFIMRVPIRLYFRHGLVYETAHGLKRFLLISMDKLTALLSTKVVCVSPSVVKQSLMDKLNSPNKQVLLLKGTCNGVDINRFDINRFSAIDICKLKEDLGVHESDFVIGFSGRLVRDKGIIELVKSFICLQEENKNITLLLVGMFEERDALPNEIIEIIRCSSKIVHTGYISNQIIENYYAIMDLFILPSYREGFPISILEASSMNIPVITTKATGCIDAIIENRTGLFADHTVTSLVNTILFFINNKEERLRFGAEGRKFIVDNFRQDMVWKEIEKLYEI